MSHTREREISSLRSKSVKWNTVGKREFWRRLVESHPIMLIWVTNLAWISSRSFPSTLTIEIRRTRLQWWQKAIYLMRSGQCVNKLVRIKSQSNLWSCEAFSSFGKNAILSNLPISSGLKGTLKGNHFCPANKYFNASMLEWQTRSWKTLFTTTAQILTKEFELSKLNSGSDLPRSLDFSTQMWDRLSGTLSVCSVFGTNSELDPSFFSLRLSRCHSTVWYYANQAFRAQTRNRRSWPEIPSFIHTRFYTVRLTMALSITPPPDMK